MKEIVETNFLKCWKTIGVLGDSTCEKLADHGNCRHCPEYAKVGRRILEREIPPQLIEEWTKSIAMPKEIVSHDTISAVAFRLKSEWFALKTIVFYEVVESRLVHYVPFRTSRYFMGLVNINGELLLCLSLSELIGIAEESGEAKEKQKTRNKMVLVGFGSERYVFPVDEFLGVIRIHPDKLQKAPSTLIKYPHSFSLGVYNLSDKSIGLLDEEKFFESLRGSLLW